jgi:hypothetical protein
MHATPGLVRKVTETHSLLAVRHSVMLLGPPGCGKSTMWRCLLGCLNLGLARPTALAEVVSPKCVSTDELYGHMTLSRVRVARCPRVRRRCALCCHALWCMLWAAGGPVQKCSVAESPLPCLLCVLRTAGCMCTEMVDK